MQVHVHDEIYKVSYSYRIAEENIRVHKIKERLEDVKTGGQNRKKNIREEFFADRFVEEQGQEPRAFPSGLEPFYCRDGRKTVTLLQSPGYQEYLETMTWIHTSSISPTDESSSSTSTAS